MSETNERNEVLHEAILALHNALDPHRQGECWPDPVAWDGRPLDEQARDLLALADATASAAIIDTDAAEIRAAASDLRDALAVRS